MSVQCNVCVHNEICKRSCEDYCPNMNPQTNYDLLINKSQEEMAKYMWPHGCPTVEMLDACILTKMDEVSCEECWLDWLKQEVDHAD